MNKIFFAIICAVFCFVNLVRAESIIMLPDNLYIDNKSFRYYSNVPTINRTTKNYSTFTQTIIVVHGTHRGAEDYFGYVKAAVANTRNAPKTLIISPRFFADDADNLHSSIKEYFHYWARNSDWKTGGLSAGSKRPMSSFEFINQILIRINDNFPKMKNVIITGYSSGGQFIQHYAALEEGPKKLRFRAHYVLANPSSYMYINTKRYSYTADCQGYNEYTYGLDNVPPYLKKKQTDDDIIKRLLDRHIILLLGNKDIEHYYLDISCEAEVQGRNRYNRGLRYYNNINTNHPKHNHKKSIVYGVGDNPKKIYKSLSELKTIFSYMKH